MKQNFHRILLFAALLLALAGALLVRFAVMADTSRILSNVTIGGIDVSGLTEAEALERLRQNGWQERTGRVLTVRTFGDVHVKVDPVKAGILLDAYHAAAAARAYGRGPNLLEDLKIRIKIRREAADINALFTSINTGYLEQKAAELADKTNRLLGGSGYWIDEGKKELVLLKAQGSMQLNADGLLEEIVEALKNGQTELVYNAVSGEAECPDFQKIHDAVFAEMADAGYAGEGSRQLIRERVGYQFAVEDAVKRWNETILLKEVRIPLEVTYPSVTAEKLEALMFHDLLGAVTTKYNNSGDNRRNNVRLAASKINGVVLYPGEVFSFNKIVGERTEEAGFLMAPAYAGYDNIKEEVGGGVCQVSTGVYAASLYAQLEIRVHTCHIYPPNYIQLGTDATVTIPDGGGREIDLKIVNNRIAPIKIVSYCEETEANGRPYRTVTVEIWGMLEDDEYMPVEFDNSYMNIYDYDRKIEPAYTDREGYKIKLTHEEREFSDEFGTGLRTLTHRKVYDAKGNLIEDRITNPTYYAGYAQDTYYYMK